EEEHRGVLRRSRHRLLVERSRLVALPLLEAEPREAGRGASVRGVDRESRLVVLRGARRLPVLDGREEIAEPRQEDRPVELAGLPHLGGGQVVEGGERVREL